VPDILDCIDERRNLLEMDVRRGKNGGGRLEVLVVQYSVRSGTATERLTSTSLVL